MKAKALFWRACFSWRDTTVRQGAKKIVQGPFLYKFQKEHIDGNMYKNRLIYYRDNHHGNHKKQPRPTPAGSDNRAARHESGQSMAIMIPRSTNNPSGARKVRVSTRLEWHPGTLSRFTNLYSIIGCLPPANRHSARPPRSQITMSER